METKFRLPFLEKYESAAIIKPPIESALLSRFLSGGQISAGEQRLHRAFLSRERRDYPVSGMFSVPVKILVVVFFLFRLVDAL